MTNFKNGEQVQDKNGNLWSVYRSDDINTEVINPDTYEEDVILTADLVLVSGGVTLQETVTVTEHQDGTNVTHVHFGRFQNDQARKMVDTLQGKTYMNFDVSICPAGGEVTLSVSTEYKTDPDGVLGMILYCLASEL